MLQHTNKIQGGKAPCVYTRGEQKKMAQQQLMNRNPQQTTVEIFEIFPKGFSHEKEDNIGFWQKIEQKIKKITDIFIKRCDKIESLQNKYFVIYDVFIPDRQEILRTSILLTEQELRKLKQCERRKACSVEWKNFSFKNEENKECSGKYPWPDQWLIHGIA